jgi:adenylate cyclase
VHIDQVYDSFALEVKKLVDFDRIAVSVIDREAGTFSPKYVLGVHFSGREPHAAIPLEGTLVERILRNGTSFLREDISSGDVFPGDAARIRAGLRSELNVPLCCQGQITGTLHVYSSKVGAYGSKEQAILEWLANQIAPAVENARLNELLRASTGQQAVVQEIARIITSNLEIDHVYEKFAVEVRDLLDRQRQWDANGDKGSRESETGGSS